MTTFSFEPVIVPGPDDLPPLGEAATVPEVDRAVPVELHELRVATAAEAPPGPGPTPEQEAARLLEAARNESHQRGFEKGRQAEAERLRTLVEAIRFVVDELRTADERREREAADRMAALATAIAGHLIEREVRVAPEVVSDLVRRAIAEFPVNEPLSVHLNPSDLALLSTDPGGAQGRGTLTSGQTVRWIPDPGVRSGGCLVEGSERVVDARLSRILERVFRVLTDG